MVLSIRQFPLVMLKSPSYHNALIDAYSTFTTTNDDNNTNIKKKKKNINFYIPLVSINIFQHKIILSDYLILCVFNNLILIILLNKCFLVFSSGFFFCSSFTISCRYPVVLMLFRLLNIFYRHTHFCTYDRIRVHSR